MQACRQGMQIGGLKHGCVHLLEQTLPVFAYTHFVKQVILNAKQIDFSSFAMGALRC